MIFAYTNFNHSSELLSLEPELHLEWVSEMATNSYWCTGLLTYYESEAWSELQLATCTIFVAIELYIHFSLTNGQPDCQWPYTDTATFMIVVGLTLALSALIMVNSTLGIIQLLSHNSCNYFLICTQIQFRVCFSFGYVHESLTTPNPHPHTIEIHVHRL